jgi:hypothetical protein
MHRFSFPHPENPAGDFSIDDMVLPKHAFGEDWHLAPTVSGGPFELEERTEGLLQRDHEGVVVDGLHTAERT